MANQYTEGVNFLHNRSSNEVLIDTFKGFFLLNVASSPSDFNSTQFSLKMTLLVTVEKVGDKRLLEENSSDEIVYHSHVLGF